jgi:hypothetical protein
MLAEGPSNWDLQLLKNSGREIRADVRQPGEIVDAYPDW